MVQSSRSAGNQDDLQRFYEDLEPNGLGALWTVQERALVDEPKSQAVPHIWPWRELRPRAMKAADLVGLADRLDHLARLGVRRVIIWNGSETLAQTGISVTEPRTSWQVEFGQASHSHFEASLPG